MKMVKTDWHKNQCLTGPEARETREARGTREARETREAR